MISSIVKNIINFVLFIIFIVVILPYLIVFIYTYKFESKTFRNISELPKTEYTMILGARLGILEDRSLAGAEIYLKGKTNKILLSGDGDMDEYERRNTNNFIDETELMNNYLLSKKIPSSAILIDKLGLKTFQSCKRAKEIYNIDKMIIVTQSWHLPRALYICNSLGIDAVGYVSDPGSEGVPSYRGYKAIDWIYWTIRDKYATLLAIFQVNLE